MTTEEKFDAITDRLQKVGNNFAPHELSTIVLLGYVDLLVEKGIMHQDRGYKFTSLGKNAQAICDEFDWKPSDNDIDVFVNQSVQSSDSQALKLFLTQCRDNRENFLESIEKFKKDAS